MNSYVIAIHIVRGMFFRGGIERETDSILQFGEKTFGGPAVAQKQEFQASALAMLAKDLGVAEELSDAPDYRHHLIPADECLEASADRVAAEPSGNSQ